jgi:histidinol-phosphatase (PHP family)
MLKLIKSHSGKFALSDDSHGPHAVGLNYHRLAMYLRLVGIDEIWYLRRTEEANSSGRFVCAEKGAGNWWEGRFWKEKGIETDGLAVSAS